MDCASSRLISCSTLDPGRSTGLVLPQKGSKFTKKEPRGESSASRVHIGKLPPLPRFPLSVPRCISAFFAFFCAFLLLFLFAAIFLARPSTGLVLPQKGSKFTKSSVFQHGPLQVTRHALTSSSRRSRVARRRIDFGRSTVLLLPQKSSKFTDPLPVTRHQLRFTRHPLLLKKTFL